MNTDLHCIRCMWMGALNAGRCVGCCHSMAWNRLKWAVHWFFYDHFHVGTFWSLWHD